MENGTIMSTYSNHIASENQLTNQVFNADPKIPNGGKYDTHKPEILTSSEPQFEIESVQLQFALNNNLNDLKVQSNLMFITLDHLVFKIDLNNPSMVKLFEFPNSLITNNWLSPNGRHFVVQINNTSYYYLHNSYEKFKVLPKFKNLNLKKIVFPSDLVTNGDSISTGEILLITNDNSILISNIKPHDQENKKDEKYVKAIYTCANPIMDVCFTNNNCQINVITSVEIHQWDCFDTSYNELIKVFKVPPLLIPYDKKKVENIIITDNDYLIIFSNHQLWSNSEILQQLGELNPGDYHLNGNGIMTKHHIILLDKVNDELVIFSKLSKDYCKIVSFPQNEKILGVVEDYRSSTFWLFGKNNIYELVITNETSKIWLDYYNLGKYDEALKYLDSLETMNTKFQKDMIYIKQGYDYLQKGVFGMDYGEKDANLDLVHLQVKGIKLLAQLSEPFEKICLMLINLQSPNPNSHTNIVSERLLIEYLLVKFYYSKNIEKSHIRIIVLSSWIIELMLRVIYKLENEINTIKSANLLSTPSEISLEQRQNILKDFNDQFYSFLNLNYKTFDKTTVYQIMHDLNYHQKLIYFADLNHDYEFILNYHIEAEDWKLAINILIKMYSTDFKVFEDTIYKKATVLLVNYPIDTIETWLKFNDLNYEKLLPSLLICNKQDHRISIFENQSIQFLQRLIFNKKIKNKVINNYYLTLIITYTLNQSHKVANDENDPEVYINKQIVRFLSFVKYEKGLYDAGFILRLCLDYKRVQPAILILINDMKLFEPALKLALDNELTDLSIFVLNKFNEFIVSEDEQLEISEEFKISSITEEDHKFNVDKNKLQHKSYNQGKKLWMMFAKYLVDRVINQNKFDFLEQYNQDIDFIQQEKNSVRALTQDIAGSSKLDAELVLNTSIANKTLSFLLKASYCQPIGSYLLGLKDVLPLFPETIMVNNFKEEIVNSLNQYNSNINQLSMEMKESLSISNNLTQQILKVNDETLLGKIYTIIEPGEPCKLCGKLLINKNFFTFVNCHHNFHKECLVKYYLMLKGDYRFKKIFQLYKRDNNVTNKKELDDIMLSECVLCNESNIVSIDDNFIDPIKDKDLINDWEL